MTNQHNPAWALYIPWLSLGILVLYLVAPQFFGIVALLSVGLIASVICAVHHAEVIAHKVGEPFGTLVLALSVTIIEVALIVSMMLSGGEEAMGLARDTIFAAVMIILNGIIGLSLIVGGKKHLVQGFNLEGVKFKHLIYAIKSYYQCINLYLNSHVYVIKHYHFSG